MSPFHVFFIAAHMICIGAGSPAALSLCCLVFLTASQSNSSLKKQRNRGLFSTFFCCFRNYNVEPPAVNSNTSSLSPPVEENGSPPKVCRRSACSSRSPHRPEAPLLSGFCCPHPLFVCMCVCVSLSYCSVTRSRSFLSLVYVWPVLFCFWRLLHAG